MWMHYATEKSNVTDLKSGIQDLHTQFERLVWDADHEAIYGMGRFYSQKECEKIAENYQKGADACEKFLTDKYCIDCLGYVLIERKLDGFLHQIIDYLPCELRYKLEKLQQQRMKELDDAETQDTETVKQGTSDAETQDTETVNQGTSDGETENNCNCSEGVYYTINNE